MFWYFTINDHVLKPDVHTYIVFIETIILNCIYT